MQFRIQESHSGLHLSGTPRSVDPESEQVLSHMRSPDLKISFETLIRYYFTIKNIILQRFVKYY